MFQYDIMVTNCRYAKRESVPKWLSQLWLSWLLEWFSWNRFFLIRFNFVFVEKQWLPSQNCTSFIWWNHGPFVILEIYIERCCDGSLIGISLQCNYGNENLISSKFRISISLTYTPQLNKCYLRALQSILFHICKRNAGLWWKATKFIINGYALNNNHLETWNTCDFINREDSSNRITPLCTTMVTSPLMHGESAYLTLEYNCFKKLG